MVQTARALRHQPLYGQLRLLEAKFSTFTVNLFLWSIIVTSAGAPTANVPRSIPRIPAGLTVIISIRRAQSIVPVSISALAYKPRAQSREMIPQGAAINSNSFSLERCGAWSVARQSMVPSATASRKAERSFFGFSGVGSFWCWCRNRSKLLR